MVDQSVDYPAPDDEDDRLDTLKQYDILDTPPEPAFDNLTELGRKIFDVPYAIVCFLDEKRQWFKSHPGLAFQEKPRKCAFCNYVLVDEETLVIEDTHEDPRIGKDNELVAEPPRIRSYAGAPLRTEEGSILGTFAVLDDHPRTFTSIEVDILRGLATAAMSQIELRYENSERRKSNQELRELIESLELKLTESERQSDEILHRTKNSFQQIRGILKNRKHQLEDSEGYHALDLAESKLHTFILLYEQLQQSRNQETISMKPYLEALIDNIQEIFSSEVEDLDIHRDLGEYELGSESAVKFGIALNEFMTNAYQHVFLPGKGSELFVRFRSVGPNYELTVRDDGPGPDPAENLRSTNRSGLKLIRDMIEHGSGPGRIHFDDEEQSTFQVLLPKESAN
jgi:two-component sensor histidine kinase